MINELLKPIGRYIPENNRLERIWILAKFDFKSRYYYHRLGILWASIRPLIEFLLYYIVFTKLFSSAVPNFALYLSLGLVIWYFFAEATSKSISILLTKRYLIENIPFNRIDLLTAINLSAFLAFLFNFSIYCLVSLAFGVSPFNSIIYFPLLLFNLFILSMGVGLILSTISIYLKDIQHLWDMIIIVGLWACPIIYDQSLLLEKAPLLLKWNPVSGIIINIREVTLYGRIPDLNLLLFDLIYAGVIWGIGYIVFSNFSHKAAENI